MVKRALFCPYEKDSMELKVIPSYELGSYIWATFEYIIIGIYLPNQSIQYILKK